MGKLEIGKRYKIRLDNNEEFTGVVIRFTVGMWLGSGSPPIDVAIVRADANQFLHPASRPPIALDLIGVFGGAKGEPHSVHSFPGRIFGGRLFILKPRSALRGEIGSEHIEEFIDRISMEEINLSGAERQNDKSSHTD